MSTHPKADTPEELIYLRGYEAGVIATREDPSRAPAQEGMREALDSKLDDIAKTIFEWVWNTEDGPPEWSTMTEEHNLYRDIANDVIKKFLSAPAEPAGRELPADVLELVIAARVVAFEDQSRSALKRLDAASEAFADRVPWDDEPDSNGKGEAK